MRIGGSELELRGDRRKWNDGGSRCCGKSQCRCRVIVDQSEGDVGRKKFCRNVGGREKDGG